MLDGQPAPRRQPAADQRAARGRRRPTSRCGPSATTARWRTSSRCRTRSRARSPRRCGSRSRRRSRRRSPPSRPRTSRPTTCTCAARATRAGCTRQDLEFALQMFENAVALDPDFALAHAAIANVCAQYHYDYERDADWIERARRGLASARAPRAASCPRSRSPRPGSSTPQGQYDEAVDARPRGDRAQARLRGRLLPALPRAVRGRAATRKSPTSPKRRSRPRGDDYNVYVPIMNALGALGKKEALAQRPPARDPGAREPPEEGARGRARAHPARQRLRRRWDDAEDAMREANLAMVLRPNDATVLYNARLHLLPAEQEARSPRRAAEGLGRRASRTPTGRAATPTSRCCTATRSSRSSTRAAAE